MRLFGNRKKSRLPEEVRMQSDASSFSFTFGEHFSCMDDEDVRLLLKDRQGYVVVLFLGESLLLNPRSWVKALSAASYVIVVSEQKDKRVKNFLSLLDSQIFSPIPKPLSGSICLTDKAEIESLINTFIESGKHCITIAAN